MPQTDRFARPLFLVTVLTGSFLLFLTQPMIARMALPRVGGAPAVWNSAMLVYQALLLGGYSYAHLIAPLGARRQAGTHLALFALAGLWLPIGLRPDQLPPDAPAVLWVPWFLVSSMGPLFFVVSAQAPLMQHWFALRGARGEPYALYAASNLGSFAGLISYPLIVEPLLTLHQQSLLWTGGYGLLVLLVAWCVLSMPAATIVRPPEPAGAAPPRRRILHWIVLAAVPSGLMLSTTSHLTTDIVAMPMLWVLPLGFYLLSFVVAFAERRGATRIITYLAPVILLIGGGLAFAGSWQHPFVSAGLELIMLFVTAVALHGELYRLRPEAGHATHLYLAMAVGGLLGGLFCAIVAPMIFDWTYEHPLLLVAAALLIPQRSLLGMLRRMWESRLATPLAILLPAIALFISLFTDGPFAILTGLPAMLARIDIILFALVAIGRPWVLAMCLAALMLSFGGWQALDGSLHRHNRTRSYFGIYTVTTGGFGTTRILTHGTTMHGLQSLEPNLRREPTTYYAPRSGVGLAMRAATTLYGPAARIGVVGLGTGTLACYALPGQDWRFFEIDPAMVAIAARGEFTYLRDCAPDARIVIGDARLSLSRQPAGALDLLALDAFSSDAVPTHLLTREAFAVYGRALQRKGILLVHISNRFVDLVPVVAANAAAGGWSARISTYVPTPAETARYASVSIWIALARDQQMLDNLELASRGEGAWGLLDRRSGFDGWSDDHASILPVLKPVKLEPLIPKETDR